MFTFLHKWDNIYLILVLLFSILSALPIVQTAAAVSNCQPRDLSLLEPGRICKKACTSDSDCTAAQKNCHCDDACGLSCFNKNLNCTAPANITNGVLAYTSAKYGSEARYTCDAGYLGVNGSAIVRCRADKKWSGSPLVCEKACGPISNVGVAYIRPAKFEDANLQGYRVGYVMPYRCPIGYTIMGSPQSRTCLATAQWSVATFSCLKRSCLRPKNPDNGYHVGKDYSFSSYIDYHCNPGYTMVGKSRAVCQEEPSKAMSWTRIPPTCEVVRCPAPDKLANGHPTTKGVDYVYGTTITYECDQGYLFVDPTLTKRTCNETGQWGPVSQCKVSYNCSFENYKTSFCSYSSTAWTRRSMRDHTDRTRYALVSTASATLTSPAFAKNEKAFQIVFYYKSNSGVDLSLVVQALNGSLIKTLWSTNTAQATWKKVTIRLEPQAHDVTWTFKRSGPSSASSYIDDITLQSAPKISTSTTPTTTPTTTPSTTPAAATTISTTLKSSIANTVAPASTTTPTKTTTTPKTARTVVPSSTDKVSVTSTLEKISSTTASSTVHHVPGPNNIGYIVGFSVAGGLILLLVGACVINKALVNKAEKKKAAEVAANEMKPMVA